MEHTRPALDNQHSRARLRPLLATSALFTLAALPSLVGFAAPSSPAIRRPNAQQPAPGTERRTTQRAPDAERRSSVAFNRDIRPILADKCFACHGPDAGKRMAGLRLDVREEAISRGAILPGRPERSALVARAFAPDPGRRMPPLSSHKELSQAQKELLRRWIAQGAVYERHWAFVPLPANVAVPRVKNAAWCRSDIDRFVLARLEQEGLQPSPEATPVDWLRRVTLDLTGIPPTPDEVDQFLRELSVKHQALSVKGQPADSRGVAVASRSSTPNTERRTAQRAPDAQGSTLHAPRSTLHAYEAAVDRLLASPRFGERMAQPWLDAARYADSYGYQSDQLCPTWPYRDWVVKAFNENLPYDQFITWQIAGDLLPNATREQRLATAFNRLHRMTNEGGSVPEEWRLEGVADRVHTFGTAILGLTFECARCHDHKYDPVSQKDYYSLSAFFNSIDEHGLYDRADIVPAPSLLLPTPAQEQETDAARGALARTEQALAQACEGGEARFRQWLAHPGEPVLPDMTGRFEFEEFDGTTLRNLAPGAARHGARLDEVPLVEGHSGKAVLLDGENNVNFPDLGRFTRHTPFTLAFWMRDPGTAEPAVVFQASSGTDTGPHGYDLLVERGRLTARMFRHWPGNAIGVRTRQAIARDTWTHVAVTYDGSSRAGGLRVYLDGKPAEVETVRDRLYKGTGLHPLIFGQRFRDRGFKGGRIDELRIFTRAITPIEVAHLFDNRAMAAALSQPQSHESELRDYYFSAIDPETRKAAETLASARARLVAAEDAQLEVAVMDEMPAPRPAYVLARGRYDAPTSAANQAGRDTPAAILPFPSGLRRDRLGLAQWLTRPDHPLTARVAVNRIWATLFGRGLVETVENFGTQGTPPSHPELLDWLAVRFAQGSEQQGVGLSSGSPLNPEPRTLNPQPWDTKSLIKLTVLSSTYRQASGGRSELRRRDPQNILLARGPSRRLSAEAVRDTALAASGLLEDRPGGPPVSPYQPGDLWRESNSMSPPYQQSVGGDLYRRSLYSVRKRTAPMPNMLAFDSVSREVCVVRRQTTNTPLQALVLLNDPQFVEAARVLGEHALKEGGATPEERVRFVFRRLATREPAPSELKLLTTFYQEQRQAFGRDAAQAEKLLKIGERKPDSSLSPAEIAAAAVLAQAVLNLDATIWER